MAIASGTRLGPYEIMAPLGAGGMGEVYSARDTRLERTVAIKVLPSHLSSNLDLQQRFEREARAVSNLNHPHICTLHDVGNENGVHYLVMEYLEGETLAQRLTRGALPVEQALRYGIEIADALDKAHKQGIVHRDLKPGNIMLTKSGAKLLDFGLAKFQPGTAAQKVMSGVSALATAAGNLTAEGSIVGTFQYMAPEQLEGKDIDARTDIFAFGTVLYEAVTAQKAFTGKSQASLIAAILEKDPLPISQIQPMTPPALDRVVKTCIAKEPDDRWQTAHDVGLQLKWILEAGSQAGLPAPVVAKRKSRERMLGLVSALLLLAVAGISYYAISMRQSLHSISPLHVSVLPPENTQFNFKRQYSGALSLSPDGRWMTFTARGSSGKESLWLRSIVTSEARPISGADTATFPFWSPDSRYLAFFAEGNLKKAQVSGGPPITICKAADGRGGTWNADGVILFAPGSNGPIHRVSSSGGTAEAITKLNDERKETTHRYPWFLPDGKHFLYFAGSFVGGFISETNAVYVASLDEKVNRTLLHVRANIAYANGFLFFVRDKVLMAQPFDEKKLALTGDPIAVSDRIAYHTPFQRGLFAVSENGLLAYETGPSVTNSQLIISDRTGKELGKIGELASISGDFRLSPDATTIAAGIMDPDSGYADLWLYDLGRNLKTRFTFDTGTEFWPVWSPDGTMIVYTSGKKLSLDLYRKRADSTGNEELLLESDANKFPNDWSPDGRFLVYSEGTTGAFDLWILPLSGDRKPYPLIKTEFDVGYGRFSPDGKWLAYQSTESGKYEVYVIPFPSLAGGKRQISTGGGSAPSWRKDGLELFYLSADSVLMAVPIDASGEKLQPGAPTRLFPANAYTAFGDGQKFVWRKPEQNEGPAPITLISGWQTLLQRK